MKRRTYSGPQPALTGGEDRPQPACAGRWFVYDVLHELTAGPVFRSAQREARQICGSCPLMAECLRANRGEPWAAAIVGRYTKEAAA